MAPGIGWAALLVLVACLVVGVAWLPPEASSPRLVGRELAEAERSESQRLRSEAANIAEDLTTAHEALRFLERRDSLARVHGPRDSAPVSVAGPDVPDQWRSWLAEQTRWLDTAGLARRAPVLTALFLDTVRPDPAAERRPWRRWWWSNTTVVAFDSAAAPFSCVAITDLRSRTVTSRQALIRPPTRWPSSSALGICRFFATHGAPGPGVRAWLLAGGWQFGTTGGADHRGAFDASAYFQRDALFYMLEQGEYGLSRCVGGAVDGCRQWVLDPGPPPGGRRTHFRLGELSAFATGWWAGFGGWLSDLEREMGRERMARFWTSPLPVDSAFATAFGVPAGHWTRDWLAARYGPLPRQGPGAADYATAVLLAGLLVAFAAAKTHGRKVR